MPIVMLIALCLVAAGALGGLVFLFFSSKTSKTQKLAALVGLALSGVALAVCGIALFVGMGSVEEDPYAFPLDATEVAPSGGASPVLLVLFLVVLVALFGAVVFFGMAGRKKPLPKKDKAGGDKAGISGWDR